jgi:monovalent cation:H+ antiporter-2, CPA2 family
VPQESPLVVLLAARLELAFVLGTFAHRLRIFPIVGYLLAGVAVDPFTPAMSPIHA